MSAAGPQEPAWYEVTVAGPVGPVLRRALEPCRAEPVRLQTIVRARAHTDVDLVDLVQWLRRRGAAVTGISVLETDAARGEP